MIRRSDITVFGDGITPEAGVYITVKNHAGTLATIYAGSGGTQANPFVSELDGSFTYYVIDEGIYSEEYRLSPGDSPRNIVTVALTELVATNTAADQAVTAAVQARADAASSSVNAVEAAASANQAGIYANAATATPNRIFSSTANGIAGTVAGQYFFVLGSGGTFASLYLNSAGSAVSQNLSLPSAAAYPALQTAIAAATSGGAYTNLLHGLTPIVTNIDDNIPGAATFTEVATGLKVSGATFNKRLTISTGIRTGGPARLTVTATINNSPGSLRVGLGFSDGTNYTTLNYENTGYFNTKSNYVGGPNTSALVTTLDTYVTGDVLTLQYDITGDGGVYVTCSKNGGRRVGLGFTGLPVGQILLNFFDNTTVAAVTFSIDQQSISLVGDGTAATRDAALLSPTVRGPINATAMLLSAYERAKPAGFVAPRLPEWFVIYKQPVGRLFFTTVDLQPVLADDDPTAFIQYVDPAAGNDTHAGTVASPLKSLKAAWNNAQVGCRAIVKAKGVLYDFATCCRNANPKAAVFQMQSSDGNPVISSMHDAGLTWTLGTSSTYSATFTETVLSVFDALNLTADGDYSRLTLAASLAACQAAPGTYYITGTTINVHRSDGIAPTASNTRVFKKQADGFADNNGQWNSPGGIFYGENTTWEGGVIAFAGPMSNDATQQTFYGKRVGFKYASSTGLEITGDTLTILQEPMGALCALDNFHYSKATFGTITPTAIEIDAISRAAGWDGAAQNNSSSSHGGITIRIATKTGYGDYHHAQGRGVHDVIETGGNSALSWMLGITSRNSGGGEANFAMGGGVGDVSQAWLDNVNSSGATFDINAREAGVIIHTAAFVGTATNTGPGTITAYTP